MRQPHPHSLVLTSGLQTRGGIQRYTHHLIAWLRDRFGVASVRVVSLGTTMGYGRPGCGDKFSFAVRACAEAIRWRPQWIICTHVGLAPVALVLKGMIGRPYIIVAHGDEVWRPAPRHCYRQAAAVVSVSRYTAHILAARHKVEADKIWIIPGALDPAIMAAPVTADDIRARHRLDGHRVLLTVSRLDRQSRYKGHERVFCALTRIRQKLPPFLYLVVGDGDDRPYLEARAEQVGLGDVVVFVGSVDDSMLSAYYRSCDLFVMPSLTDSETKIMGEGFGIAYIEAAAFGKPAIAGRGGGAAEAVLDGVTGLLVDPENVDEIAHAIVRLVTDDDLRHRLGQQASTRAWSDFSFERFGRRWADVFATLGARGDGP